MLRVCDWVPDERGGDQDGGVLGFEGGGGRGGRERGRGFEQA